MSNASNTYPTWWDAYREALFRAALTGYRYRVRQDEANGVWSITELTQRWDRKPFNIFWDRTPRDLRR